jgi:hypothetical protein
MSSNHHLLDVLKTLNYGDDEIRSIMAAAESAKAEKIGKLAASRGTELPSPVSAAAQSPRHAALLRQTLGMIRQASGQTYSLPLDKPVDADALAIAIRAGSIENRMAIKSNLARLGCMR